MTQPEGSALAHFINSNSSRFLAMTVELSAESRVLVLDGAKRTNKGYGFPLEPVTDIEEYLRRAVSGTHDLPEEYVSLLIHWYIVHDTQKADRKRHTLRTALWSTLSPWQKSMLDYCYESRRGAQAVAAEARKKREDSKRMSEEVRERLAYIKQKTQHTLHDSSVVLNSGSRCLQEINRVLASKEGIRSSPTPARTLPALLAPSPFPEVGRRRCSVHS